MKKIFKLLNTILKYIIFAFRCVGKLFFWRRLPREQRKTTVIAASFVLIPLLVLIVFTLINAKKSEAAWFDDSFQYRQRIDVTNSGSAQTDFQVSVTLDTASLITANKMQSNCNDIRIVDQTGKVLPHVIEEGSAACNTATTKIWTKVASIPTTAITLWIYYGNPNSANVENGNAVFVLFDNFNNGALDTTRWGTTGATSVASGALTITTGSVYTNNPIGSDSRNLMYEYREKYSNAGTLDFSGIMAASASGTAAGNGNANALIYMMTNGVSLDIKGFAANGNPASYNLASSATLYTATNNTYVVDGFSMDSTQIKYWNNGSQTGPTVPGSFPTNPYVFMGYFTGRNATTQDVADLTVDWIRVRKYAATAPSVASPTNEEKGPAPVAYWKFDENNGVFANNAMNSDITSSMVGYWKMDEASWTVNCSTTSVSDSSGNGNNGKSCPNTTGPTTTTSGKFGNAGNFDNTDDYVEVPASSNLNITRDTPVTLSAWINKNATGQTNYIINRPSAVTGEFMYGIIIDPSNKVEFYVGKVGVATDIAIGATSISSSTWYHVVGVYDGYKLSIYVNGVLDGTAQVTTVLATSPTSGSLYIGKVGSNTGYVNSKLDDIRIYYRALTAQQVSALYGATGEGALLGTTKPTWQPDNLCISSKCLLFDGTSSYVQANASGSGNLNQTSPFTISAWVKTTSTGGSTQYIFNKQQNVTNELGVAAYLNSSNQPVLSLIRQNSSSASVTGNALNSNQWYYLTFVYDGNNGSSIYVNGRLDTSGSGSLSATTTSLGEIFIGAAYNQTNYFKGFLDDVKFYNYQRSASQLLLDYNSKGAATSKGAGVIQGVNDQSVLSNGLTGYWKLDEASGNATDSAGTAPTLINNNSTTFVAGIFGRGASLVAASSRYFSTSTTISGVKTIAFWINPSATTDEFINLTSTAYITASSGTVTGTGFTNPKVYVNGALNGTLTASTWNHVVVTSDTGIDANQFEVGRANSAYTNGTMDEVRTYNRVFSGGEVNQLYNFAPAPVGYWNFEEGQGGTLKDVSGFGNNGTWAGPSTHYTNGKYGKGGYFSDNIGSSTARDYVTIPDSGVLQLSNNLTVEAWFKTSSNDLQGIVRKDTTTGTRFIWSVYINAGNVTADYFNGTTNFSVASLATFKDNQWHHAATTINGTTLSLYVDGVLQGTKTINGTQGSPTGPVGIGVLPPNVSYTDSFDGSIDEVKIYNYARTASQLVSDMNADHPPVGSPVSSPLGYWKLDEGYGTKANSSGSIATMSGTLTGGALWSNDGKFGKSITFDGTSGYIDLGNQPQLFTPGAFTVSVWVSPGTSTGANQFVFSDFNSGGTTANFSLQLRNSDRKISFFIGDGSDAATSNTALTIGTWYHVVGVYNGTTNKIYINGVLENTTTQTQNHNSDVGGNIAIGKSGTPNVQWFRGKIDEVKYYNYALTDNQVKLDMNRQSSQVLGALSDTSSLAGGSTASSSAQAEYCVPGDSTACPGPKLRLDLEEKTGTTANDSSTTGNTFTYAGTMAWAPGKVGSAVKLNGTNAYLRKSVNDGVVDSQLAFTVCLWMNTTTSSVGKLYAESSADVSDLLYLSVNESGQANKIQFAWGNNSSYGFVNSTTTVTDGAWHYVCGIQSSASSRTLYIDGVAQGTDTTSIVGAPDFGFSSVGGLYLGADPAIQLFNGRIDGVQVFTYARSTSQLAWDYNRGAPVAWYKMDECQGTTINDSTGNRNTGTFTVASGTITTAGTCSDGSSSSAWYTGRMGKLNYSLNTDTGDFISVSNSTTLEFGSLTDSYSVGLWVNTSTNFSGNGYLIEKGSPTLGEQYPYSIYFNASTNNICFDSNDLITDNHLCTDKAYNDGIWHHVLAVRNTSTDKISIYIDGVLVKSDTDASTDTMSNTSGIFIGKNHAIGAGIRYYTGKMDDIRIYRYALTPNQIKTLYNNGAVKFAPVTGTP